SSSFRPKKSDAPRCGQEFWTRPSFPDVVLKAMRFSPSKRTRNGGQSGEASSSERTAGIQYWRMRSPPGVPGPTRQSRSLSCWLSIAYLRWGRSFLGACLRQLYTATTAERTRRYADEIVVPRPSVLELRLDVVAWLDGGQIPPSSE